MVRKEEEMEEATMTHDAGSNEQENAMEGEEEASEGEHSTSSSDRTCLYSYSTSHASRAYKPLCKHA